MRNFPKTSILLLIMWCLTSLVLTGQNLTIVQGKVTDSRTGEAIAAATIRFDSLNLGARTDAFGKFTLKSKETGQFIVITCIGYDPLKVLIKPGETNELQVRLMESSTSLNEVEVVGKSKKYRNKNNLAVDFMREVIAHKEQNRKENLAYYSLERYDKIEFAINNIDNKLRKNFLFRKTQFIFDNVDTNKVTGKVNLPFYLRESLSDVYYRKSPRTTREYVRGEKSTRLPGYLDDDGISNMVENLYREIDFYNNSVNLVTVDFISPLSDFAPSIYQFYLRDTSMLGDTRCVHLYFTPKQKTDLAFNGDMWIAFDSSYALQKIQVEIPPQINLNWVNGLQVEQEFGWVDMPEGKTLLPVSDVVVMEFGVMKTENSKTILAQKTSSYARYSINQPVSESLLNVGGKVQRDSGAIDRNDSFWAAHRHDTLDKHEEGVYYMVDSLKRNRNFRRFMNVMRVLVDGYHTQGKFDIGPINTFSSFNPIEGYRLRLGGRTNLKFNKRLLLEGYGAYGFHDTRLKGFAGLRYSFGPDQVMKYPLQQLRIWYQNDMQIPGQDLQNGLLLSFRRGVNDKMLYAQTLGIECLQEWKNGFSYAASYKVATQSPAGTLRFDYLTPDGFSQRKTIITNELGLMLRYAPNEKFYQAPDERLYAFNKYPTFQLWYSTALKGVMGGEYHYHVLRAKVSKGIYIAPLGWASASVEAGRIFGQAPYTLLVMHPANQTFAYSRNDYNLMNNFEFVSDKFASINISHNFGGFFFNRVPLLRRLKLREVVTFKALWGGLDQRNRPNADNSLILFPVNDAGESLTHTLEAKPYIEASVGISNIFRVLRIDVVRRMNYLNLPNTTPIALRAKFQMEF
ncbi:MAG: carboxypeptidase-like regulatory domain-containing protein [Saprospiraceae bacterium]|nr:carboxypeptidase-like regulatory domain-containing protein [Saprospiraceae bacterium]